EQPGRDDPPGRRAGPARPPDRTRRRRRGRGQGGAGRVADERARPAGAGAGAGDGAGLPRVPLRLRAANRRRPRFPRAAAPAAAPDFLVPRRERGRVLYSANRYTEGAAAYAEMVPPSADERLQADLAALAERDARAGLLFGPCLAAGLAGDTLTAEASKAAAG